MKYLQQRMPHEVAMLTDVAVRNAKPRKKPYKLADERALYLLVTPTGGKLWRFNYRFGDKHKTIALGAYPDVSLARVREKRDEVRRLLADGIDPLAKRKADKVATAETFRTVTEEFLAQRQPIWAPNHYDKVKGRLEWLYPYIGDRPVSAVQASELLGPLRAIEAAGKGETAARTRLVAGQVFRYAIAAGKAQHDPTSPCAAPWRP
jgi:hypothetical protein